MKTPIISNGDSAATIASPIAPAAKSRFGPRAIALIAACIGLSATVKAAPVIVPDASFEDSAFPLVTNAIAPGGTAYFFNSGDFIPPYDWWGTGFADQSETNSQTPESFPTVYIQDVTTTNALFPLAGDNTLEAPGDGTNYLVLGGSGDDNVWQPLGPLQPNTIYTLTVAVGIDDYNGYLPADGSSGYGGGTALIALVSGNTTYDIFSPGAIVASMVVENTNYVLGTWVDNTLIFTNGTQSSGDLTILLRGLTGFAVDMDNIRLDATPIASEAVIPTVTTDLGDNTTTVYQGTPVTLSENPAGTAPFTYQWQTDSGTSGATWSPISDATNFSTVIDTSSINPGTPVEYEVVVNGSSTSPEVTLSTITNAPVLVRDSLPSSGSFDVVGSTVAFSAVFDGSRPISYQWQLNGANIPGATNELLSVSLTDTNQSGAYSLLASNSLGTNASAPQTFTVNPTPSQTNGVVLETALEWGSFFGALGYNQPFTPSWTLATNSLLAGLQPIASSGIFSAAGCGGLPALTDGSFADISPPDNGSLCFATCGTGTTSNGIGYSITYTLPVTGSGAGWTITNITSYGGWSDDGREEQTYQVSYSTPLAPTNFNLLPWTAFNPPNPPSADYGGGVATATKMSIVPTSGVLAKNVAAVQFNFYSLAAGQTPKNGWEGYAEFQVFGLPSSNFPPVVVQNITPQSGSDVEGSLVTLLGTFASVDPINYTWLKDGTPIPGQTNASLTLANLQLSDTATNPGYVLEASNTLGVATTDPCSFVVNPAPGEDGSGVIVSEADQAVPGGLFTPTWDIPTNSLLAGLEPFLSSGNFQSQNSANGQPEGGVPTLTDGQYGAVGQGDTLTGASCGIGYGQLLFYTLPPSSNGWNITSISSFGGWSDIGRNQQEFAVYYALSGDPDNFLLLDQMSTYVPPVTVAEPNATRVIWTSGTGLPLATNVVAMEFDFAVEPETENAWEGYNELQVFGTNATVAAAQIPQAPIVVTDVAPGYGSDVEGSQATFTAQFGGAAPLSYQWQFTPLNGVIGDLPGATNQTLTLTDLNTNMSGNYDLLAFNAYGTNSTSVAQFTVNSAPTATNGVIYADAVQIDGNNGLGLDPTQFLPTWAIASGSLIASQLPSTVGPGNFEQQSPSGGLPALTDGVIGQLVSGGAVLNYADGGTAGSGAGQFVIYTLHGSPTGYTINSIVSYGGWPDYGRDWQYYTVSYSTVANPGSFQVLGQSAFQLPQLRAGGAPNAGRVTWTSGGGGPLASNVAAVEFNFTIPTGQENGWQGYSELQIFGTPTGSASPTAPTINTTAISGGNLVLTGSGGTPSAAYTWLTATNLATPIAQWTTNSSGSFDTSGNFSNTITINHSEPARFFLLSTP